MYSKIQRSSQLPLLTVSAMEGGTPLHIRCINCHDKQLNCELHHQIKGSCYNCNVNGLQCLFSPTVNTRHLSSKTSDVSLFQRNCVHCTRSHLKCVFLGTFPSQCQRCSRLGTACLFKLSSQGRRSDLIARTDANDPNRCPVNASESVHCPHRNDVESCHARVCLVNVDDRGVCDDDQFHRSLCPPSWVHAFAKSNHPSSIRTQAASMAYIDQPVHKKARHRRNRRSKKKLRKHQRLLTEVVVPTSIQNNLLSESDIVDEVVVVDGGDDGNPPIRPPDGVNWRRLSVIGGNHMHIPDETDPCRGLTFARVDGALPFIRLPRKQSLDIISQLSLKDIVCALEECEKLKKTSVTRSDNKRIFGDYGKPVMYTCVGVQPSRNSREVLDCNRFIEKLPERHSSVLMKFMHHVERCYESLAESEVMSHMFHARQVVPFKTMSLPGSSHKSTLKYYGALAFGCNVFLPCHTDSDFTMSMAQIHLKGKDSYDLHDNVVVYFCFPTLGVAIPMRPGDFLIFNALIPHCLSSRCREVDQIYSLATYLKTSVVGLNNNQLHVSSNQRLLAERYRSAIRK